MTSRCALWWLLLLQHEPLDLILGPVSPSLDYFTIAFSCDKNRKCVAPFLLEAYDLQLLALNTLFFLTSVCMSTLTILWSTEEAPHGTASGVRHEIKHLLFTFFNCTLCLANEWMFLFLLYSILLDEEGHIKITGMWETENFMPIRWFFFFCSILHASWYLFGKSLLTKTRSQKSWSVEFLCQFVNPHAAQHIENIYHFLGKIVLLTDVKQAGLDACHCGWKDASNMTI